MLSLHAVLADRDERKNNKQTTDARFNFTAHNRDAFIGDFRNFDAEARARFVNNRSLGKCQLKRG
jgi:hypothetical protein